MSDFMSKLGGFLNNIAYPAIDQKMNASGKAWVAEARRLCPVDTGQLRDSIGYIYDQKTRTLTFYADKSYAIFQELGTRYIRAHPFMRPALQALNPIWGVTTQLQATMIPEKYIERTQKYTQGRVHGYKKKVHHELILGHIAHHRQRHERPKQQRPQGPGI